MTSDKKPVALTGIKPTGAPHVGNLLGMYRPAIDLTADHSCLYFIADYHALTSETDGKVLRENTYNVAATWMALGLDTDNHILFRQSDIPEVCELAWILSCFTSMGLLNRAHAYKDALARGKADELNHGVFGYPVLMAADILLYDTDQVPVGKDQKQHIEMCRDMAQRINHTWGEDTLVVPEPFIREEVATVPGLDGRKMSKSYDNSIEIFLPPKQLRKRIMKIVTGTHSMEEPKDPETCNVYQLFRLLASKEQTADLAGRYKAGGLGYGHAKQELFELYESIMAPHRERYDDLMANRDAIDEVLASGRERARTIANRVLDRIRPRAGLR